MVINFIEKYILSYLQVCTYMNRTFVQLLIIIISLCARDCMYYGQQHQAKQWRISFCFSVDALWFYVLFTCEKVYKKVDL